MATKNLVGNPNGILETEVNTSVAKSGFGQGISPSHFFTMNEGEIKIQYDELLEPNSEIKIKNQWLAWQSPLVSRNLTNQRVRTHYIAQSIKNMWADYRSYMFGGRYGDFPTPELHFRSSSENELQFTNSTPSKNTVSTFYVQGRWRYNSDYTSYESFLADMNSQQQSNATQAFFNSFFTYFTKGSLGEHLGFQTDIAFSDINTPNPWPFMAYLNFYKWFVANKYVLRGDNNFKKIWFPDNEDDFKFHCGNGNRSTGIVGRFFSPEHRSGISFRNVRMTLSLDFTAKNNNPHHSVLDKATLNLTYQYFTESNGSLNVPNSDTIDCTDLLRTFLGDDIDYSVGIKSFTSSQWNQFIDFIKVSILEGGIRVPGSSERFYVLDLFETRYMNFNKDYFTGGLISPLISGDYPQISGSASLGTLTAETTLTGGSVSSSIDFTSSVYGGSELGSGADGYVRVDSRNDSSVLSVSEMSDDVVDSTRSGYLISALNKAQITNTLTNPTASTVISGSGSATFGFSIPDLRLLSATTEYLEALARSDGDYRNMVLAIYGVKPTEVSEAPIYLGGSSGFVQTENIFQTSPSDSSPLGSVTQTGFGGGSDSIGSYFAKDTTVVLGLISIVPEIFYYQGVPKKWVMRHKEEHQNPKFNGLSMQAIENRELFVSGNDSVDTLPFAYAPAWEFMRHRQNRLSGLLKPHFDLLTGVLLDKPFSQMAQSRGFIDTPDFNNEFISTKGNISTEHLYTQDTNIVPEFTIAIKNDITEILPITRSGVPSKI